MLVAICAGCAAPAPQPPAVSTKAPAPERKAVRPAPSPSPAPPAASAPAGVATPNPGEQQLLAGIQSYDDGEYKLASRQLRSALELGLDSKRDEAKAHKYLAFIVCVTGREKACRDHFRKALEADPAFELEPAEAGNPTWSAALRRVKGERTGAKAR